MLETKINIPENIPLLQYIDSEKHPKLNTTSCIIVGYAATISSLALAALFTNLQSEDKKDERVFQALVSSCLVLGCCCGSIATAIIFNGPIIRKIQPSQ